MDPSSSGPSCPSPAAPPLDPALADLRRPLLLSYDSGIIGSVISDEYVKFHEHFNPTSQDKGAIVALLAGGCFFGAFLAGWTANKYGRKRTIQVNIDALLQDPPYLQQLTPYCPFDQLGSLIAFLGCLLQAIGTNLGML